MMGSGGTRWDSQAFSFDTRLETISAKGDPLEALNSIVPFESFRADIDGIRWQRGGRYVALYLLGGEHPVAARDTAALVLDMSVFGFGVRLDGDFLVEHDRRGLLTFADLTTLRAPLLVSCPLARAVTVFQRAHPEA
jgi:hypothetical protein